MTNYSINYSRHPTCKKFHESPAFVRGIMGPFASGKSVACLMEIYIKACEQEPDDAGVRKTRWIIARNTLPELETTTMKTWDDWFPQHIFGRRTRKPPYTQMIKQPLGDGTSIEMEVIFLPLDKPEDAKKLLSFEVTGVFFNESREIAQELIQAATGRVGRYPSAKDGAPCTWSGIIMDTNPPHSEHWWYKCAEEDAWAVDDKGKRIDPSTIAEQDRWEFFKQPSGLAANAENLENLMQPPGHEKLSIEQRRVHGRRYYTRQIAGKSEEWINVYVHGNYGYLRHGLSVYGDSWNPDTMTSDYELDPIPGKPILLGVDASGRHPAAIFAQKTPRGQLVVLRELVITQDEGLGATNFARLLRSEMETYYPNWDWEIYGDPAGEFGSQNDERTYFDILKAEGIFIKAAKDGLREKERIETMMMLLNTNVDGDPALMVSPRCKNLLGGFNGGYQYKKVAGQGEDIRYHEKVDKNRFADSQDALQYIVCGTGYVRKLYGKTRRLSKTQTAKTGSNIFSPRRRPRI